MSTNVIADCDSWCITDSGRTAKTTFMWTIKNFKDRPEKKNEYMESLSFSVSGPDDRKTEWYLTLYPKGQYQGKDQDDYVTFYLNGLNDFDVKASYSISIVDSFMKEQKSTSIDPETYDGDFGNAWGGECLITFDELKENSDNLLPDGHLTLLCKLEVFCEDKLYGGSKKSSNKAKINYECKIR